MTLTRVCASAGAALLIVPLLACADTTAISASEISACFAPAPGTSQAAQQTACTTLLNDLISLLSRLLAQQPNTWPAAPGAVVGNVDAEMAPFYAAAGTSSVAWLEGDTLGAFLYGSQTQTVLHGTSPGYGEDPTGRQAVPCNSVASLSGLGTILVAGQSNSANSAYPDQSGKFYTTNAPIYELNIEDGKCYVAKEPLLGGNGGRQAFALPLADQLIGAGVYKAVLLVPIGQAGTFIEQWTPANRLFTRFTRAINDLRGIGLQPTFILWHQGEANAGEFIHSDTPDGTPLTLTSDIRMAGTLNWMRDFFQMVAGIRGMGVSAPIFPAIATLCGSADTSSEIERAQRSVIDPAWGIYQGPNTDALSLSLRSAVDGCHFSSEGNIAHARAWYSILRSTSTPPAPAPAPAVPAVTLTVNGRDSITIARGQNYTLAYGSSNVTSCTMRDARADGTPNDAPWPIPANTAGSGQSGLIGSYTLTCTDASGQSASKTVTISAPTPAPSCTLAFNPSAVAPGQMTTLSYTTQNAYYLEILGLGASGASAGSVPFSVSQSATYTGVVTGVGGTGTCQATVTVVPAPSCTLTLSPSSIAQGGSATLSYATQNATYLSITGVGDTGASSGSTTVSPQKTTTYTGTASGGGKSGTCQATLTVN